MTCVKKSMAVAGIGISLLAGGCNSNDPSVQEELTRLKAEKLAAESALAKKDGEIASLKGGHEAEMADLKGQLEKARSKQPAAAEPAARMPTPEQVEMKLSMETMKLRRSAEQQLPGYVMKDFRLHDINIPSPDAPFQARVTMTMVSPKGEPFQMFWQGKGDMMGNWHYDQVKDGFPDSVAAAAPTPPVIPRNPVPTPPVVTANPTPPAVTSNPTPPVVTANPTPPPVKREPVPDPSKLDPNRQGAMPATQSYVIDPSKQRPMKMGNP
jgi:hypothetical protein